MLFAAHISEQAMNSISVSRRLRRGASSVAVVLMCALGIEGRNIHTITPHSKKASVAAQYIKVKPKPIDRAKASGGPTTHASETCARKMELNITASRPVFSECSRANANICGLAVEPKLDSKTPMNSRIK